jgi:hypothetical protein
MGEPGHGEITELLLAWSGGEASALDKLIPLVYAELRRLAHRYMRNGSALDHTLKSAELINEAYLRLVDSSRVRCGRTARIFWPYPRRRCGAFWSRRPVRESPSAGAAYASASRWKRGESACAAKHGSGELDEALTGLAGGVPAQGAGDRAALLRRAERGRNGHGAGRLRGYRAARLEAGPDLAAARDEEGAHAG